MGRDADVSERNLKRYMKLDSKTRSMRNLMKNWMSTWFVPGSTVSGQTAEKSSVHSRRVIAQGKERVCFVNDPAPIVASGKNVTDSPKYSGTKSSKHPAACPFDQNFRLHHCRRWDPINLYLSSDSSLGDRLGDDRSPDSAHPYLFESRITIC